MEVKIRLLQEVGKELEAAKVTDERPTEKGLLISTAPGFDTADLKDAKALLDRDSSLVREILDL